MQQNSFSIKFKLVKLFSWAEAGTGAWQLLTWLSTKLWLKVVNDPGDEKSDVKLEEESEHCDNVSNVSMLVLRIRKYESLLVLLHGLGCSKSSAIRFEVIATSFLLSSIMLCLNKFEWRPERLTLNWNVIIELLEIGFRMISKSGLTLRRHAYAQTFLVSAIATVSTAWVYHAVLALFAFVVFNLVVYVAASEKAFTSLAWHYAKVDASAWWVADFAYGIFN